MREIESVLGYRRRLIDVHLDEVLAQLPGVMLVGARATGKTTTLQQRARTTVRLAARAEAAAFIADPDAVLRGLDEPVLLDEWQEVPGVLGAATRAINVEPRPSRFLLTGSVDAHFEPGVHTGSGRILRIVMYPMTLRERIGSLAGPTFFDRLAAGDALGVADETPDLRGYVEIALESGFPIPALLLAGPARTAALEAYVDDLLTHDVPHLGKIEGRSRTRDQRKLRRYFDAYALSTAGTPDDRTLFEAAQVSRDTAAAYGALLASLFVVDDVPAWRTNRLQRLVQRPKRYLVDAALMAAALGLDVNGILRDGDLLGRVLDTFVTSQLRPELVVSRSRPRLYHVRTEQGRHEIDLVAELGGGDVIGIEVKASAAPRAGDDDRHLVWLRGRLGERFRAGVVLHTGPRAFALGDRIVAAPISAIWGR